MSIINAKLVQRNPDIHDSQKNNLELACDYLLISRIILATCFLSGFKCFKFIQNFIRDLVTNVVHDCDSLLWLTLAHQQLH